MVAFAVSWIFAAGALLLSDRLFAGFELKGGFLTALWVAACYAVLAFLFGWLIFGLLGIATLGLGFVFHFLTQLITAALVLRITSALSSHLSIGGFFPALCAALMLALASELSFRVLG
ncbi:MAG TPA: phage holin family protein [Polyangiaceae bacterium]|nr:phage holin family protein [Polyangiaceae bacterium]